MKKENQIIICTILLVIGLLGFILQVFVFEAPDGVLGFILFLFCVYLILGSIIKLCKLSENLKTHY